MADRFPTYFEVRSTVDGRLVAEVLFYGAARALCDRYGRNKGERLHFREVTR